MHTWWLRKLRAKYALCLSVTAVILSREFPKRLSTSLAALPLPWKKRVK